MNSHYDYYIMNRFYDILNKDYNEIDEKSKNKIIKNVKNLKFDRLDKYYKKNKCILLNLDYVIKKICKNNNILLKKNIIIPLQQKKEQEILWNIINVNF